MANVEQVQPWASGVDEWRKADLDGHAWYAKVELLHAVRYARELAEQNAGMRTQTAIQLQECKDLIAEIESLIKQTN
jgi:hypothetical protein